MIKCEICEKEIKEYNIFSLMLDSMVVPDIFVFEVCKECFEEYSSDVYYAENLIDICEEDYY